MRILHVFPGTAPTYVPWAADVIRGLCGEQLKRGHHVRVVATNIDRLGTVPVPLHEPVPVGPVDVYYCPLDHWAERLRIPLLHRFAISTSLAKWLWESCDQFDIVHIHFIFPFTSLAAGLIGWRSGVPYVVTLHGNLDPYMHAKSRRWKDLQLLMGRRILNGASAVHMVSEGEREATRAFGITSQKVVIGLGVDADKYPGSYRMGTFRARWPTVKSRRIVMYLGRISYTKGLDLLARAFSIVAETDSTVHLVLVGPDDETYGSMLKALFSSWSLTDRVTFTGRVSDEEKVGALLDADVCIFPSYTEALGLAMLEAMACGKPVIVTERTALAPELLAARAARVVPSKPQAVADAIRLLLAHPDEGEELGRAGRSLVRERFSWPSVTDQFLDLYESVTSCRYVDRRANGEDPDN